MIHKISCNIFEPRGMAKFTLNIDHLHSIRWLRMLQHSKYITWSASTASCKAYFKSITIYSPTGGRLGRLRECLIHQCGQVKSFGKCAAVPARFPMSIIMCSHYKCKLSQSYINQQIYKACEFDMRIYLIWQQRGALKKHTRAHRWSV